MEEEAGVCTCDRGKERFIYMYMYTHKIAHVCCMHVYTCLSSQCLVIDSILVILFKIMKCVCIYLNVHVHVHVYLFTLGVVTDKFLKKNFRAYTMYMFSACIYWESCFVWFIVKQ